MTTVLSPAESLGLSGAALEARIRRAAHHVADGTFVRLAECLAKDAFANEMIYEREGVREPVRIMLRPLLARAEQLSYVHHVCLLLTEALKRLPVLYLGDADVRRVLAITKDEERWLRDMWTDEHSRLNPVYGRLDAVCDFTAAAWQDSLKFMEPNLSGVGGIHFGPVAEALVMRDVVPTLIAHDPALQIEMPRDQRDLFVQILIDHARALGRGACQLCFIEPKYAEDGPDEQSVLSKYLSGRHGIRITHADPRELRVKDGEVFYEDQPIDVAYRDYETRELIALEAELGRPLDGMRRLFRENRVVSSFVGDFDHKSCWELLTDESLAERFFSIEERRLFRRHVLWTRVVGDRRTSLPHNQEGDLLEFARHHREELVLKPNRAYGGEGVAIGAATSEGGWERLLNEAARQFESPELSWVVQSATRLPVHEFPVVGKDGRVFGEPFYAVMGFAPTENGLGTMVRVSQKQVVNVAQHGGLAALLVAQPPAELKISRRSLARADGPQEALKAKLAELVHLDRIIAHSEWDEETTMPEDAWKERGEQLATLENLRHELLVSDRLADLIEDVSAATENDERWCREITLLKRLRRHALAVPAELVRALAAAKSCAIAAWERARAESDFRLFAPELETIASLTRERAAALSQGRDLYDALLDEYEPEMTRARLDPVFAELKAYLAPAVARHAERAPARPLSGQHFPEADQWLLCRQVLSDIGFDFRRGRLDRSTHPFTTQLGFDDIRLTTRFNEADVTSALLATMHEGGHALYDQGFAATDRASLLGDAPSMGLHEAQARLWENHVGRSKAFWRQLMPALGERFGSRDFGADGEAFYRAVTRVSPGVNRVNADELSYHLHIILRYEIETALVSGALEVRDLPDAWNASSKALLGVVPKSDLEGVLQDSHWAHGMFGYFPTYTLGSLYAAQLVEAYGHAHALEDEIGRGEFARLLAWLRKHVHAPGNRWNAEELVSRATGRGLEAKAFFSHIEARYGG